MQSCGHNSFWNLESHLTDLIYFTRKRNKLQWAYVTIARVALAASSSRNIKCHHYWWADELHWVYAWSHTIYPLYIITYLKVFWRTFLIRRYEEGPVVHPPFLRSVCMSIYIYIFQSKNDSCWLHWHADDKQATSGDHQSDPISSWVDATLKNDVSLPLITLTNCLQGSVHAFTITS